MSLLSLLIHLMHPRWIKVLIIRISFIHKQTVLYIMRWLRRTCFSYHDILQLHVQKVCSLRVWFPVLRFLAFSHIVQNQLKEDDFLRNSAECIIKTEHVVSLFCFHSEVKKSHEQWRKEVIGSVCMTKPWQWVKHTYEPHQNFCSPWL